MLTLIRAALGWIARHALILVAVVVLLVAVAAAKRAYDELPALEAERETLAEARRDVALTVEGDRDRTNKALATIDRRTDAALKARLAEIGEQRAGLATAQPSPTRLAVLAAQGDGAAIVAGYVGPTRRNLLNREDAAIRRVLAHRLRTGRPDTELPTVAATNADLARTRATITTIERRYPQLLKLRTIPGLADQARFGPWNRHRALQRREASQERQLAGLQRLESTRRSVAAVQANVTALDAAINRRANAIATSPVTRIWTAVRPVLWTALWILAAIILLPIALKAFWFFVVAPLAARSAPVIVRPDLSGKIEWASERIAPGQGPPTGSAVARKLVLAPGDELLVKPEWLQSSMTDAAIDSKLLFDWSIPLSSIATGLIGLTRIRVSQQSFATIAATTDAFDEVGVIAIPTDSGLVFHPSALIGVIQHSDAPIHIERVWRLGHLSAWLTLQLRYLVFHGPGELIVRGARGVALEPALAGRRIGGAATLGFSAGTQYSVRRSETFLAYLRGQQSLFNDGFAGENRFVVYEQFPRTRTRGSVLGRGLEGLGDGVLKAFGL